MISGMDGTEIPPRRRLCCRRMQLSITTPRPALRAGKLSRLVVRSHPFLNPLLYLRRKGRFRRRNVVARHPAVAGGVVQGVDDGAEVHLRRGRLIV